MTADFDKYVKDYIEIINKGALITGEDFEYFIQLRIALMKEKICEKISGLRSINILDFGCGIGATEVFLKNSFTNAKIFGIDTSAESVNAAKKLQLRDVFFSTLEAVELPFEDNYFDLIYSNGTFHHMEHKNHRIILIQLFRVLKEGGDLFIFENNPYNPVIIKAMKKNPFDKNAKAIHPKHLKEKIINAGFQLNTVNYYFFYPKWLKFLRFTEKYLQWFPLGAQYFIWGTKRFS